MKKNLQILEIENKIGSNGKPYSRIKTEDGWMACFDGKAIEELQKNLGKNCSVETRESVANRGTPEEKTYQNISKYYAVNGDDLEVPVVKPGTDMATPEENKKQFVRTMPKDPVGLAVDVFNQLLETQDEAKPSYDMMMTVAISLVQQAQKAFN